VKMTVCDYKDCLEEATLAVEVLEGDFQGDCFDACSIRHAQAYLAQQVREYKADRAREGLA